MKRVSLAVYVMALSLISVLLMVGYVIRENHNDQKTVAAALELRSTEVNDFLRTEVCERLALRDEIQLSYLQAAYARYETSDPAFAETLQNAIRAIEFTRSGCVSELPDQPEGG